MMTVKPPNPFCQLMTRGDVARWLGVSLRQLTYILYGLPIEQRYRTFEIAKRSGGRRTIWAPLPSLRLWQKQIQDALDAIYRPPGCVYGFVKNRSIVANAAAHSGKRHLLNVDIRDFFPEITFRRVRGMFQRRLRAGSDAAGLLAHICTTPQGLPAGAPSSPVISNMVCNRMDCAFMKLAKEKHLWYTRYADDLSFSTSRSTMPATMAIRQQPPARPVIVLGSAVVKILKDNGFEANLAKVRLQDYRTRQTVTGLRTNRFPNVGRPYLRRIRAMLHVLEKSQLIAKGNPCQALEEHIAKDGKKDRYPGALPRFEEILRGRIEFVGAVRGRHDAAYRRLAIEYQRLVPGSTFQASVTQGEFDVFMSHASEDKPGVVQPLVKACRDLGLNVWYDVDELRFSDGIARHIDYGLANCRVVVAVISTNFANKNWPRREVSAAVKLEIDGNVTKVLPLFVGSENIRKELMRRFPLEGSRSGRIWCGDPQHTAKEIYEFVEASRVGGIAK